ncbi:MAG: heme lyase CcmF/NrfE family subunit, partial [Alphaproteobacteria bacterium]|nr:heme lyase CcmF/NrfE family subunit [Alphaproteobacteria bacterium]
MTAELANALLALAALLSTALALGGIASIACDKAFPKPLTSRVTLAVFMLVTGGLLLLLHAFAVSDFSVANVYQNSHTAKPMLYKITGSWGNHEGSMLLWVWMVAAFAAAFAVFNRHNDDERLFNGALIALAWVSAGFLLFILLTSNPFERLSPVPFEGQDLNPLLQDIGLAIHPPLLYLGYVGFSVVFALTTGALLTGRAIDSAWAKQVQPWALLAWGLLTWGIGLGSWWAYRELGWGGWWFWDPVENISLLPWVSGTALIHCLLVLGKRPMLQNWTLLLSILTFALSLMGTFLVRSGLLTSVHSFASDPERGMYILLFTATLIGGSLWLYAIRYPKPTAPDFTPVSREGGILVNNLLLLTACATVFLGIIYPIMLQVFDLPSVSVGAPFYDAIMLPLAVPLLLVAAAGPMLAWRKAAKNAVLRQMRQAIAASAI